MTVTQLFRDPSLAMGARVKVIGTPVVGSLLAYHGGLDGDRQVTIQADGGGIVHAPLWLLRPADEGR